MTDDEIIAVVQAHKEGKKIEVADRNSNWRYPLWSPCPNPTWNFNACAYRVAPEPRKPREWNVYEMSNYITSFEPVRPHHWKPIRVREVIE